MGRGVCTRYTGGKILEPNYTLISIIGIIAISLVVVTVVALVGLFCYKFEKLRVNSDTKIKTNLQDGKIEAETSVDIDGNTDSKVKNDSKQKKDSGSRSETLPLSNK